MLNSIEIKNLLSFGPEGVNVELRPLNVLIGPNGCGKSNFLTAIRILQNLPGNLQHIWNSANSAEDWFWGNTGMAIELFFSMDHNKTYFGVINNNFHSISFSKELITRNNNIEVVDRTDSSYSSPHGSGSVMDSRNSIFSQKSIFYASEALMISDLENIKIYSERPHGNSSPLKSPQMSESDSKFLSEQFDNLAVILHELNTKLNIENLLLENFQKYYPRAKRIYMGLPGGRPQIFIQEKVGNKLVNIPASRLSDGTLYFLCLLTMLTHPNLPPLICIDEPEVGLHPDILSLVADLLVDASKRTQIIITTHSDLLVSAIGKRDLEAIIVCDHTPEKGTSMTRPNPQRLQKWLDESQESLGELWLRGAIGGTLY
jgi:predicted ATPase